ISRSHRTCPGRAGWPRGFDVYGEPTGNGLTLRVDRAPNEAGGQLLLEVDRYPLTPMRLATDNDEGNLTPEIAPRHHDGLVHWALFVAYSTRDMEGAAPQRAAQHEAEFIKRFGIREDANVMRKKRRHRAPVCRP